MATLGELYFTITIPEHGTSPARLKPVTTSAASIVAHPLISHAVRAAGERETAEVRSRVFPDAEPSFYGDIPERLRKALGRLEEATRRLELLQSIERQCAGQRRRQMRRRT